MGFSVIYDGKGTPHRMQHVPQKPEQNPEDEAAEKAILQLYEQLLKRTKDRVVTQGKNEKGEPITTTVSELAHEPEEAMQLAVAGHARMRRLRRALANQEANRAHPACEGPGARDSSAVGWEPPGVRAPAPNPWARASLSKRLRRKPTSVLRPSGAV